MLRVVALRSDPFRQLDWSAGLMTDEGFNIHNARNLILFGHVRTDEYNNMLMSPLFHFAQVPIFKMFGVGAVQARLISVICSLLTLLLLWMALRRVFDSRIAFTAVALLGLDHTNLLYNRMALMDTPAALLAVMAFYAFARGATVERRAVSQNQKWPWFAVCGCLIALTVTVRIVSVYLLLVPFVALGPQLLRSRNAESASSLRSWRRTSSSELISLSLGTLAVLLLYFLFWYWPHYAELSAMSHYYRARQIPNSLLRLSMNVYDSLLGSTRALADYLFRHSPIMFTLALLGLLVRRKTRAHSVEIYLVGWLLLGLGLLAVSSYSPSRYYVTTYPALAALAAISLWRLPELYRRLEQRRRGASILRAALTWFVFYHIVQLVLDHYGIRTREWAQALLYAVPTVSSFLAFRTSILNHLVEPFRARVARPLPKVAILLISVWFVFNAYWLGRWIQGLEYTQYNMSQWLSQNVPPSSVLIGDVAPGVCLDNSFIAVYVEPKLWNDKLPIEAMGARYPGATRYIVMDDRWKYRYWMVQYPDLVGPDRLIEKARVLNWDVGVYSVDR